MVFNIPPTLPPSTPIKKSTGVQPVQPDSAVESVQSDRPAQAVIKRGDSEKRRKDRRKEKRRVLFDMRSGRDRRHDQGRIDEDV